MWKRIQDKTRCYRLLKEILNDAKESVLHTNHPYTSVKLVGVFEGLQCQIYFFIHKVGELIVKIVLDDHEILTSIKMVC